MAKQSAAGGAAARRQKQKTRSAIIVGREARRQGGYISKKSERGKGLKFRVETFAAVSQFTPGTRIRYGPNPKRPDSKSFARYAGYQRARTVGEALLLGSKKEDLLWELERGDYKVLGGARSRKLEEAAIGREAYARAEHALSQLNGPAGCPVDFKDPRAAEKQEKEEAWRAARLKRVEHRAKDMHLRVETTADIEASGESADIRLQRRVADAIAVQKLKSGRRISDEDVSEVFEHWGFTENTARLNVMPKAHKYVYSDTVGAIRARSFGFGCTPPTWRYPNFVRLLCRWLKDNAPPKLAVKFVCTAINLNCNYAGRRHRDQNNEGPSVIRAFGKFRGGRLLYFPRDTAKPRPAVEKLDRKEAVVYDLARETVVFNGNSAHEVEPFTGERYSIVFFTARGYNRGKPKDVKFLKDKCGFPFPSPGDLAKLKRAAASA